MFLTMESIVRIIPFYNKVMGVTGTNIAMILLFKVDNSRIKTSSQKKKNV